MGVEGQEGPGRVAVLYGSQTGTAAEHAARVWRACSARGVPGVLAALDEYPVRALRGERLALFLLATTGQGEEPDNMKAFWRFLLRKSLPADSLCGLKFGVLAFGDSSYAKFNFVGKKLHRRLLQLGATPLLDIGLCDYQHDLGHDAVMTPWLEKLWLILKQYFPNLNTEANVENKFIPRWKVSLIQSDDVKIQNGYHDDIYFTKGREYKFVQPKELEVVKNIRTTSEDHFQDVRLLTFKISDGAELIYKPGDVFNVRPRNSKESIEELFEIFRSHNMGIEPHHRLKVEEISEGT